MLEGTGAGSPFRATCGGEREFSKQNAVLLLEGGGRNARQPKTTHVYYSQTDGKGISLNQMGPLWDFPGLSPRVSRLYDLNLRDWNFWILCLIWFSNVHSSVSLAWTISIGCIEHGCHIFAQTELGNLNYRRTYSLIYSCCHREQTYAEAE